MKRTYDSSIHCQAIISKEVSPIEDKKIYLLAELTILPGFLEEVKAILKEALIPTLQEPGCEALYETGRKDDPHRLVFFEVFSSVADMSSTSNRTIQSGC
jgi:quinol monooxygenase YgiN